MMNFQYLLAKSRRYFHKDLIYIYIALVFENVSLNSYLIHPAQKYTRGYFSLFPSFIIIFIFGKFFTEKEKECYCYK